MKKTLKLLSIVLTLTIFASSLTGCCLTFDDMSSYDINSDGINSNTTVKECLLYSGYDVKIFAKSLENNSLHIYIENNSNLNLGFNAHSYAVNGIMTKENIYSMDCDVSANSKANTELKISKSFLQEHKIERIEQIDILFWAYDNDKSFKEFETDIVTIKTSDFKDGIKKISGTEIYNKDKIKIDFLKKDDDEFTFCLTNQTGNYFDFTVDNININGYTVSDIDYDIYNEQILNNCQFVFTIKPDNKFLKTNNIDKISDISFNLEIEPVGDYSKMWSTEKILYKNN